MIPHVVLFSPFGSVQRSVFFIHLVNTEAVVKANTVPVGVQRELLLTSVEITKINK